MVCVNVPVGYQLLCLLTKVLDKWWYIHLLRIAEVLYKKFLTIIGAFLSPACAPYLRFSSFQSKTQNLKSFLQNRKRIFSSFDNSSSSLVPRSRCPVGSIFPILFLLWDWFSPILSLFGVECILYSTQIYSLRNSFMVIMQEIISVCSFTAVWQCDDWCGRENNHSFIYIAPLQVRCYSEALSTQHGYCVGVSGRSATGNCS